MDSGVVGWFALWGAVAAATVSCLASATRRPATAARAGEGAAGLAGLSVAALAWSLLSGNFALTYVADTTTRHGAWPYRLAGMWGGNGGSLLLWAALVLGAGFLATRPHHTDDPHDSHHRRDQRRARQVVVAIGGALLAVDAAAANPFARLAIPAIDGGGLTPILQYPAMLYHPILLYAGHAALVAPFALTLAALAGQRLDEAWVAVTRRWMLVAWLLLGVALIAGAYWAYVELGWGGFWGWDPVENSGLLPWLAATAFLHRARATTKGSPSLAALAVLPFALSLVGTTVSRSGAAQSVHAFAQAMAVGRGLLAVVVVAVGAAVVLVVRAALRGPQRGIPPALGEPQPGAVPSLGGPQPGAVPAVGEPSPGAVPAVGEPSPAAPPKRDWQHAVLAAAVVALLALALVILVGTVFPVLVHAVGGQTIEVTTRYYGRVVTPLAIVAVALMGIGPLLGQASATKSWLAAAAGGAAVTALLIGGAGRDGAPAVLAAAATGAAVLAIAELARTRRLRRAGALVAHTGMAVLLLGTAGSLLGSRVTQVVRLGGQLSVAGYTLHYRDLVTDEGAGWQRARVVVDVREHGHPVATLNPAIRVFAGQAAALSDVAMRSTPARDLLIAVSQIDPPTGAATMQVTVRPLVVLVWWGGLLAAAGGGLVLLTALPRRRKQAPAVVRRSAAPVPLALEETVNRRGRRGWVRPLFPRLVFPRRG